MRWELLRIYSSEEVSSKTQLSWHERDALNLARKNSKPFGNEWNLGSNARVTWSAPSMINYSVIICAWPLFKKCFFYIEYRNIWHKRQQFNVFNLQWSPRKPSVRCKDAFGQVVKVCPHNSTCFNVWSSTGQGCCLLPHAISCGNGMHCCPADYRCDENCASRKKCLCWKN